MANKIISAFAFLLLSLIIGCGGQPASSNGFMKTQALTCTGQNTTGACDESDGSTYYKHYSWSVDGNTFQAVIELGVKKTGLFQIDFPFPFVANIKEVHTTETINNWCNKGQSLGVESNWDGNNSAGIVRLLGSKIALTKATNVAGEETTMPDQQVFFPALDAYSLTNNTYVDLCANATVNWTLVGTLGN